MLPFADEEVYSAEFVYESIYEEIPAEVSEVKVKPFHALAPLTRTPQTTRTYVLGSYQKSSETWAAFVLPISTWIATVLSDRFQL